jgi:protein-S-isoprenylcysteine O-methyltransferase Ste14
MRVASRIPELGPRGEGWFALQLGLVAAIVGCGFVDVYWPHSVESFLAVLGLIVAVAGAVVLVLGGVSLGRSFTPFPRPHPRAEFRESGAFKLVRHPIYGGVVLVALGWSIAEAPLGLIPTALLAAFFDLKARREEAWLAERYLEYAGYRVRTPYRFVPWLY